MARTSANHRPPELRTVVDSSTTGRLNIRLADAAPAAPPANWAPM